MTEQEWLACTGPEPMLTFLRGKASDRKLRLFAGSCCRRIWDLLDGWSQNMVGVAEAFVDGSAGALAMTFATGLNYDAFQGAKPYTPRHLGAVMVGNIAAGAAWAVAWNMVSDARRALRYNSSQADTGAEAKAQVALVRCCFGNPFRPSPPLPDAVLASNGRTIPRLAQAIYEERKLPEGTLDTDRLAILADALLDAGCDDEALLSHLRDAGPHVRGCWAVDLILGKE